MKEPNEVAQNEKNDAEEQDAAQEPEVAPPPDEFRLTIRKLEMPVRPRGVLAE
jgi:hypothetical protein